MNKSNLQKKRVILRVDTHLQMSPGMSLEVLSQIKTRLFDYVDGQVGVLPRARAQVYDMSGMSF